MPTYEYECKSCSHIFEAFHGMSESPIKVCPQCGNEVRRLINGGNGIIFKGSGFYVTDKNKLGGKTSSSAHKEHKKSVPATSSEGASSTTTTPPSTGERVAV
jgi:putative FmdB family regulatory protein